MGLAPIIRPQVNGNGVHGVGGADAQNPAHVGLRERFQAFQARVGNAVGRGIQAQRNEAQRANDRPIVRALRDFAAARAEARGNRAQLRDVRERIILANMDFANRPLQLRDGRVINLSPDEIQSFMRGVPQLPIEIYLEQLEGLTQILLERIERGKELLSDLQAGHLEPPAPGQCTLQDVADITLALDSIAKLEGQEFSHGAYSVLDHDGRIAKYLDMCPQVYQRSSTHMKSAQDSIVGNAEDQHRNTHRGIDLTGWPSINLPHGHRTILYSRIPAGENGNPAQRLFLKMESHGARISTLGENAAQRREGSSNGMVERPRNGATDRAENRGHAWSLVKSKFTNDAHGVTRKERIPREIAKAFTRLIRKAGNSDARQVLRAARALDSANGIKTMCAAIQNARNTLPENQRLAFDLNTAAFAQVIAGNLTQVGNLSARIGNEMMIDQINGNPNQVDGANGGDGGPLAQAYRALFPHFNEAQCSTLAAVRQDDLKTLLSVLPGISRAVQVAAELQIPDQIDVTESSRRFAGLTDNIASSIVGQGVETPDDIARIVTAATKLAVESLGEGKKQHLTQLFQSREFVAYKTAQEAMTLSFSFGARSDLGAAEIIGPLSKSAYFVDAFVSGSLHAANVEPQALQEMPSIVLPGLEELANAGIPLAEGNENHVAQQFVTDCIDRDGRLSVGDIEIAGENRGEALARLNEAIPDERMRLAVTKLAHQGTFADFMKVMQVTQPSSHSGIFAVTDKPIRFTFNPEDNRFTATCISQLQMLVKQPEPIQFSDDSTVTHTLSFTLVERNDRWEIEGCEAQSSYDWDLA